MENSINISRKQKWTTCETIRVDLTYMIKAIAITTKLNSIISGEVGPYKCDFRQNRSVMDQAFIVR